MWKQLREKGKRWLKGERGIRLVVLAGVVGMALILLSSLYPEKQEKRQTKSVQTDAGQTDHVQAYCDDLEQQLTDTLKQIEGVGNCQVMLTAGSTAETVYVQDEEQDTADNRIQSQKKTVLISDSGGESALVQRVLQPQISGVIVVCDGAASSVVQERVSRAVQAVLDLPAYRVCIVPFQKQEDESVFP